MNYLEIVQKAMSEAGITQTDPAPSTLVGVTGITKKFKDWATQAWEEFQIENDQAEFRKSWFDISISPRFYFDVPTATLEPDAGDTLTGQYSGATLDVERLVIANGGTFLSATAQGVVEFSNLEGIPIPRETFSVGLESLRFIRYGDYDFTDTVIEESPITDMETLWWESLEISSIPAAGATNDKQPLKFIDYPLFMSRYNYPNYTLGRPEYCTETPDGHLMTYPGPDQEYTISGFYIKNVESLSLNTDTPTGLKSQYHMALVWRTVWLYGQYEHQPYLEQKAKERYMVYKKRFDSEGKIAPALRPIKLY